MAEQRPPLYAAGEPCSPEMLHAQLIWGHQRIQARINDLETDTSKSLEYRQRNLAMERQQLALVEEQILEVQLQFGAQDAPEEAY